MANFIVGLVVMMAKGIGGLVQAGLFWTMMLVAAALPSGAYACACCTDSGQRFVDSVAIDGFRKDAIHQMDFAATAEVWTGERDLDDIKGIRTKASSLQMSVRRTEKVWFFSFDDRQGNTGNLEFMLPSKATIFEVDPRSKERSEGGVGPGLYKEWRLTSKAVGGGMLRGSVGGNQMATLIFHGGGNSCPDPSDFHAWTLTIYGSKANVILFGDLKDPAAKP